MLWQRNKTYNILLMGMLYTMLTACSNTAETTADKSSYCFAAGYEQEFSCDPEARQKPKSFEWDNTEKFRTVLSSITAPLYGEPKVQPKTKAKVKPRRVIRKQFSAGKGYTIQLGAFKIESNFHNYIRDVEIEGDLYQIPSDVGWHSISFGYYKSFSAAKQASLEMQKLGLDYWIRPIQPVTLKIVSK